MEKQDPEGSEVIMAHLSFSYPLFLVLLGGQSQICSETTLDCVRGNHMWYLEYNQIGKANVAFTCHTNSLTLGFVLLSFVLRFYLCSEGPLLVVFGNYSRVCAQE